MVGLSVCLSVCVSVGHVHEPCENGSADQDTVLGLSWVGPGNHVLDGVPDMQRRMGNFLGSGGPLLSIGTPYSELCQKLLNRSRCHLG